MSYEIYEGQTIKAAERVGFKLPKVFHLTDLSEASGKILVSMWDLGEDVITILRDDSYVFYSIYCQSIPHDDGYSQCTEHLWEEPPSELISVYDLHDYFNQVEIDEYDDLYKAYLDIEQEHKENVQQRRIQKLEQDILQMEGEINKLNLKKKELSQYLSIMKNGSS